MVLPCNIGQDGRKKHLTIELLSHACTGSSCLTVVQYSPPPSFSNSRERPKSETLHNKASLTKIFRAAKSFINDNTRRRLRFTCKNTKNNIVSTSHSFLSNKKLRGNQTRGNYVALNVLQKFSLYFKIFIGCHTRCIKFIAAKYVIPEATPRAIPTNCKCVTVAVILLNRTKQSCKRYATCKHTHDLGADYMENFHPRG